MSRAGCCRAARAIGCVRSTVFDAHHNIYTAASIASPTACTPGSETSAGHCLQQPYLQLFQQLQQPCNKWSGTCYWPRHSSTYSSLVDTSQEAEQPSQLGDSHHIVAAGDPASAVLQNSWQQQQPLHTATGDNGTVYSVGHPHYMSCRNRSSSSSSDSNSYGQRSNNYSSSSSSSTSRSRRSSRHSGSRQQRMQSTASAAVTQARRFLAAHKSTQQPIPEHQQQMILQELAGAAAANQNLQDICSDLHLAYAAGCNLGGSNLQQPMSRMLDAALKALLRDLPTATASTIKLLLGAYEVAAAAVPPQALQQIIDHMLMLMRSGRASSFDAFRLIRSATYTRLHLQEDVVQQLMLPLMSHPSVRSASLVKVIQSFSYSGQPINQDLAIRIIDKVLEAPQQQQQQQGDSSKGVRETVSDSSDSTDSSSVSTAHQSASLLKAVNCMGLSLPQHQMKRLMQPLLHQVLVLDDVTFIPAILISMSRMSGVDLSTQTVKNLMMKAVAALKSAAATAAAAPSASGDKYRCQSTVSSSRSSTGLLSPSLLVELLKAVAYQQQRLPAGLDSMTTDQLVSADIYLPGDVAEPLTDSFLAQQPSVQDMSGYLAALAGTTFWDQAHDGSLELERGRLKPQQMLEVQQQLQQQQQLTLRASEIGGLLWAVTHMGYCFPCDLMIRLLQGVLDDGNSAMSYNVTQALWAISGAALPTSTGSTEQQQQQKDVMESLLHQLTRRLLQQYQSRQQQQYQQQQCWQLSLAAWTIALCDAHSCKDVIWDIARELAQPAAWQALRESEHVQLLAAHLWLCDYQWGDYTHDGQAQGLARVLSAEQMQQILKSRRDQVADQSDIGTKNIHAAFNQHPISRAAKITLQRQRLPGWQDVVQFTPDIWDLRPHHHLIKQQQGSRQQGSVRFVNQANLFVSVCRLPYIQSACLEQVTADGLFSIDIAAETKEGQQLAIEFDGPWHYKVQVMGEQRSSAAAASHVRYEGLVKVLDVVTRSTLFRNRALAARGYQVVPVYYRQWPGMDSQKKQREAAHQIITDVLGAP